MVNLILTTTCVNSAMKSIKINFFCRPNIDFKDLVFIKQILQTMISAIACSVVTGCFFNTVEYSLRPKYDFVLFVDFQCYCFLNRDINIFKSLTHISNRDIKMFKM